MNRNVRVIARLDVKGPNVVKGVQFEALRVMGKPADMAEEYYLQGADELLYLDVVASLYRRESLLHIVREASKRIFIPFTAGGGVRSIEDIHDLLQAGAEKVAINTAAIARPELIREAAERFGKQCVVVSIEAKKIRDGAWEAYTDGGREKTGLDVVEWAKKAQEYGAGEILLTSVDREGTERGLDKELIRSVCNAVTVPVIASGGASSEKDIASAATESTVAGVALGSLLHYKKTTIATIKGTLLSASIGVRPPSPEEREHAVETTHDDLANYNQFTLRQLRNQVDIDPRPKPDVFENASEGSADVSIVDYGINNIRSVFRAIENIGKKPTVADTPEKVRAANKLILPGVGAFAEGMRALRERGLDTAVIEKAKLGTPIFGICLGLQLLFDESEEFGWHKGLGLVKGKVIAFPDPKKVSIPAYTLPNIGWSPLSPASVSWERSVLRATEDGAFVYFVHSFYPVPSDPSVILAQSHYGGMTFCAAIQQENITATQFHAEKSGVIGIEMLRAFCEG